MKAGALGLQGGSLVSSDVMEGLSVRSGEDVAIAAGIGKDVMVSGDSVMVNSARSTAISAQKIELASGWNQEISMDAAGGSVRMGSVKVSGSRVGTDDVMHGMAVRSGEDVAIAAESVVVSGGAVAMTAVKNVEVAAGSIALSTEWGGDIDLVTRDGAVEVEDIALSGSTISTAKRATSLQLVSTKFAVHGGEKRCDDQRCHCQFGI